MWDQVVVMFPRTMNDHGSIEVPLQSMTPLPSTLSSSVLVETFWWSCIRCQVLAPPEKPAGMVPTSVGVAPANTSMFPLESRRNCTEIVPDASVRVKNSLSIVPNPDANQNDMKDSDRGVSVKVRRIAVRLPEL